jgi:signal peptidase I
MAEYELQEAVRNRKARRACLVNALLVVGIAVGTFLFVPVVAQVIRVQGDSMAPALQGGQLLFLNRLAYWFEPLEQGDIIVFRLPEDPNTFLVKRVIALPGDRVSIKQGAVSVNDQYLKEPYVAERGATSVPPVTIEDGTVFVLGDHRMVSNDSRVWGLLPVDSIIGRAEFSIWPLRPIF